MKLNVLKNARRVLKERIRRLLHPRKYRSISFLCGFLGEDVTLNKQATAIKNRIVTGICTFQSVCPPKDNACLVYINPVYGNTDILKYATRAMRDGALVLITDRSYSDYPCIISKDPIKTYSLLCNYYRELSPTVRITAVTCIQKRTIIRKLL